MARRGTFHFPLSLLLVAFALAVASGSSARAEAISFNRDVRPILADKCFACHGPEAASRKAGFRLDQRESAIGEAESGMTPVTPGDPDASELVARITTDDESLRMPPADSHKTLTPEEIETLRRWIAEGAMWEAHWSFTPPVKSELPAVAHEYWPRGTIDRFILARLEQEKLTPAAEADQGHLLRRVTLDLTGLPPTPAEVDDFLADNRPDAYERAVDRLLASPRYGEHMARFWLDAARYGDTHGLHLDNYREMWPFRDWVVRRRSIAICRSTIFWSSNSPAICCRAPTDDQLIATGFNRCHVSTNEGGVIAEEVYVTAVIDRVETFGTVMLGLTVGCTRCHDHKYDPLTQGDFYSLFAYFNSLDGNEMDGNREDPAPVIRAPLPEQAARLAELDGQIAAAETKLAADWPELDAQQVEWERQFVAVEPESVGGSGPAPAAPASRRPHVKDYLAVSDWHWVGPFSDPARYLKSKKHGPEGNEEDRPREEVQARHGRRNRLGSQARVGRRASLQRSARRSGRQLPVSHDHRRQTAGAGDFARQRRRRPRLPQQRSCSCSVTSRVPRRPIRRSSPSS
jgi:hypothetical protein